MTDIVNNIGGVELEEQESFHAAFLNKTPQQVENWIDMNVVDLNSAKDVLKKLARVIVILAKREREG